MNINSGSATLVLLCPGTVILHSRDDDIVPFADSLELVRNSGLPASALIEVGSDHWLADPEVVGENVEGVRQRECKKGGEDRMRRTKTAFKFLLALFMVAAGTNHFVNAHFYLTIMPPYLPFHLELVYLSGVFEVAFGVLLFVPRFSRLAASGIVALLIAVFPANIYLYQHQELFPASPMVHFLRLPLQVVFVLWAYWHTTSCPRKISPITAIISP